MLRKICGTIDAVGSEELPQLAIFVFESFERAALVAIEVLEAEDLFL